MGILDKPLFIGELPVQRIHFFELHDSPWFPVRLRSCIQACLTKIWTLRAAPFQARSGAQIVAEQLRKTFATQAASSITDCTFVDFCCGAGGPTPEIALHLNEILCPAASGTDLSIGKGAEPRDAPAEGIEFVLTDLHPHISAWTKAVKLEASRNAYSKRPNILRYVPESVDATAVPADLLASTVGVQGPVPEIDKQARLRKKIFGLFNLSFHHFDDDLAMEILRNALTMGTKASASTKATNAPGRGKGFAIFELQGRNLGSFFTVALAFPLALVTSWYWFWGDWFHLFFTYIIPVIPAVTVWDGIISSLRTRRPKEMMVLVHKAAQSVAEEKGMTKEAVLEQWQFESGFELHTWPGGRLYYFIGVAKE